jgi:hypothetical protein
MKFAKICCLCQLLGAATLLHDGRASEGFTRIEPSRTLRNLPSVSGQAFNEGRDDSSLAATESDARSGSNMASTISGLETKSAETRRLLEELDSIAIDAVKLNDVERLLNEQLPHGCLIDHKNLEEHGIDAATVSCQWSLTDSSLATMLEIVLEKADLAYRIQDGILVITTEGTAEEYLELVVYDATVLFDAVVVVEPHMVEDIVVRQLLNQRLISESLGDLAAFREALDKYVEKFGPRADELRYNRVSSLVESLVDPNSWENNGGVASLSSIGKRLIVRQTERNHRKIRKLLEELNGTAPK